MFECSLQDLMSVHGRPPTRPIINIDPDGQIHILTSTHALSITSQSKLKPQRQQQGQGLLQLIGLVSQISRRK